jgi:hypothetical protein
MGWRAKIGLTDGIADTYGEFLRLHASPACEAVMRA